MKFFALAISLATARNRTNTSSWCVRGAVPLSWDTKINVGSLGQPRDGNPQLSFGLPDTDTWTYQNIRAEYNVKGAAQTIVDYDLPRFLADRFFRGV